MTATAKLFMHGRSQAVRLRRIPAEAPVQVSKVGDKVISGGREEASMPRRRAKLEEVPAMFRSRRTVTIKNILDMMTRRPWNDLHRHQCRDRSAQWPAR
jgi:hypothetical protein